MASVPSTAATSGAAIERLAASAYRVPTETDHESDGTLVWDSTDLVVVEAHADGHVGLGYTYCHPAAAAVVSETLADVVKGADAVAPGEAWKRMQVEVRQMGHAGIAAMAVSAVDVALWDLKSRLLGLCLADALPRCRRSTPTYGSGGFCNYSDETLRHQLAGWVEAGCSSVKMKIGRDKARDPRRVAVAREAVGDDIELMVDANGAYAPKEAVGWAERFAGELGVSYLEEPVSSQDLAGLRFVREHAPGGLSVAAGEYGWNLTDSERMLDAGAVDILQADVSRCGGITGMLGVDALCRARSMPFSAHCCPAITGHVGCAMQSLIHAEYFFDHARVEGMLFEGALGPEGGALTPDRTRPGLGLELRREDARRYRLGGSG